MDVGVGGFKILNPPTSPATHPSPKRPTLDPPTPQTTIRGREMASGVGGLANPNSGIQIPKDVGARLNLNSADELKFGTAES